MAKPTGYIKPLMVMMLMVSSMVEAQDIGILGKQYPFAEQDFAEVLLGKVRDAVNSGLWDEQTKAQKQKVYAYLERPTGRKLPSATEDTTHFVDPSYSLPQAVLDEKGRVLYPAGFTFNPLLYMRWDKRFCFIDADQSLQIQWAKAQCQEPVHDRVVLVSGAYLATQKTMPFPVYFDQYGKLSERFLIQSVPALVYQEDEYIRVDTYALE